MGGYFKPTLLAIVLLILTIVAIGCPQPEEDRERARERETTTTERATTTTTEEVTERIVTVNQAEVVNGLRVEVTEMVIEPDQVSVGLDLTNETRNRLSFFPDVDGVMRIDNLSLEVDPLRIRGDVSGTVAPGGTKSGTIFFDVPEGSEISPGEVTQVELFLGDVFNEETFEFESFEMTINLEQ